MRELEILAEAVNDIPSSSWLGDSPRDVKMNNLLYLIVRVLEDLDE